MNMENKVRGLKKHVEEVNLVVVESIKEALLLIAKDKPLEKITIIELCNKAGVSRMGFYNNFKTKDDVIKRIVLDLNYELVSRIGSPFRQTTDETWYYKLMDFVMEKYFIYESLLEGGFFVEYLQYINEIVLHDDSISEDKKYQRVIWNGGLINCISYWITQSRQSKPQNVAEYCNTNLVSWSVDSK